MIIPAGAMINAIAVIIGAGIGMLAGNRMTSKIQMIVFQALGLCTMIIGIGMALKTQSPLIMICSILVGATIGEIISLDVSIGKGGDKLKALFKSGNAKFTEGFISATVLFCIGSMAIIGSLNEGISGDLTVVLTKTALDFCASIAFGAAFGSGVMAAALPILVYQGGLTICAAFVSPYMTDQIRIELEAVGGIMVLGIGLNMLELKKLSLSNFLPALVVVIILCMLPFGKWFAWIMP